MEMFELKYFLGVAAQENIHRASEILFISPASLSKAISRLEEELSIKLFYRDGRNIRLTDHGKLLQIRASEMVELEQKTTMELSGFKGTIQVQMIGPEILLSKMGLELSEIILKKYPLAKMEYLMADDDCAVESVIKGQAHLALITKDITSDKNLFTKIYSKTQFYTFVGKGHPLYARAKSKKEISIDEVLTYPFVSPSNSFLGKVGDKQSFDGWRDDKFLRTISYRTSSLKMIEELLESGSALAYLPEYLGKNINVVAINMLGCSNTCKQNIKVVTRHSLKRAGWLNQIL